MLVCFTACLSVYVYLYQLCVSIVSLTCRMNSSASSSEVLVLLHQVDESGDGLGLEVDIAVKSEQVRVLGFHLFDENKL